MIDMIDITSVFASNIVGLLLMSVLLLSKGWRIQSKNSESGIILIMIFAVIAGCILEPIAFYLDGQAGIINRIGVYTSNTLLFFLNTIIGPGYITLIERHINEYQSKAERAFIFAIISAEMLLLAVNLFYPVVFGVDERNAYYRCNFFWL